MSQQLRLCAIRHRQSQTCKEVTWIEVGLDRLDSIVVSHELCLGRRKDIFGGWIEHVIIFIIIWFLSQIVFTELDRVPFDPELVEHVLIVNHILRCAFVEALHQGHDSVLVAEILDKHGGSKARWDSGEGQKAFDVLARFNHLKL